MECWTIISLQSIVRTSQGLLPTWGLELVTEALLSLSQPSPVPPTIDKTVDQQKSSRDAPIVSNVLFRFG